MNAFYNNKNTIRIFLFLAFLFLGNGIELFAQTTIYGKVIDNKTGEELIGAKVMITNTGGFIYKTSVNKNGSFKINVDAGEYVVVASFIGYPSFEIERVIVFEDEETKLDIELEFNDGFFCGGGLVCWYKIPLLKTDVTTSGETILTDDVRHLGMKNLPTRSIEESSLQVSGISWQQ